jgi:hypothetical protein
VRSLIVTAGIASLMGCGPPPLSNAARSADELARAVLQAYADRDESRLRSLALDEREFRDHVWPSLPAARPERNLPFSYVWGDLRQKSDTSLRGGLARYGGQPFVFEGLDFAGGVTDYPGYRVHRGTVFRLRDSSGSTREVRLCGSFVEKDGVWKVFSYVTDD